MTTPTNLRMQSLLLGLLLAVAAAGTVAAFRPGKAGAETTTSLRGTIALTAFRCSCPGNAPNRSQIYLLHLATGKLSRLTHDRVNHMALGWSPDGSRLLDAENGPAGQGLYSVRSDGSSAEVLLARNWEFSAQWSPDGTRVAYLAGSLGYGARHGLYTVNADGTHRRLLAQGVQVFGPGQFGAAFSWAPDGRKIVFVSHNGLSTVTTRGKPRIQSIRLQPPSPQFTALWQPTWSPDGSRIAFTFGSGPINTPPDIAVVRADGSGFRALTKAEQAHGPVWSPNNAWLAFRGRTGDVVLHPDGTGANTWGASWSGITFSPNSAYLAYVGGEAHAPGGDLYIATPDGAKTIRVLNVPSLVFYRPLWRGGTASTDAG